MSTSEPVNVSRFLPIPYYETWRWGPGDYRAVHVDDASVIHGATYRELVVRCFMERTRRQGIEIQPGRFLIGLGGDYLSGPGG